MTTIRIARGLLVLLIVAVGAIYLPEAYWLAFDVNVRAPRVVFSPVLDSLLFVRSGAREGSYTDLSGKQYTREEFESLTPLANYRQLAAAGTMPDSLRGIPIDLKQVSLNNISLRVSPERMDAPEAELLPMFESRSGRVRLEMPPDMFRITSGVEFLTAASNSIDTAQSRRFTESLSAAGFTFPARTITGNPTTMKGFDEGYFVVDAAGKVFHVKKVRGAPYCAPLNIPDSVRVRGMLIQEMPLREFYGLLIAEDGAVYLISYDHYALVRLPVEGYDPSTMTLFLAGDLFFRTITVTGPSGLRTVVTDRAHQVVTRYEESWPSRFDRTPGQIAAYLFPFTLKLSDPGSLFVRPFFRSSGLAGLAGILVSLGLMLVILRLRKEPILSRKFDLLVIALSGVFGLLATNLIRRAEE